MDDTSEANFIRRCIKNGHHSILEHASASLRPRASRLHAPARASPRGELLAAVQRYVNEDEFNYVVPPDIQANTEASALFDGFLENARLAYRRLREMGIKRRTRALLPNALESEIVFSANFRELRPFSRCAARGASGRYAPCALPCSG